MVSEVKHWIRPTVLLCLNGFFRWFNPSEAYMTPYLMGPHKNLTQSEVLNQVYPVWIYSFLGFLVPAFLLTDLLKYKPVLIAEGLIEISCWLVLIFGEGVKLMQLAMMFYGMATAAELGYHTYIYSIVPTSKYQQVTSYTRAVVLIGRFLGSILAQLLVSLAKIDYLYLNYIALANISVGFLISFSLPMPQKTVFFYTNKMTKRDEDNTPNTDKIESTELVVHQADIEILRPKSQGACKSALLSMLEDLKLLYHNHALLRWLIWSALLGCGHMIVMNYIQTLWEEIHPSANNQQNVYNGAVESLATVLGAAGAFIVGYVKLNSVRFGELMLGCCSLMECGLFVLMYWATNIWASYSTYVLYVLLYNFASTYSQFQLAVCLNNHRFALVVGVDVFAAVSLNMILTAVFVDEAGFGFDVKSQVLLTCVYFGILSLIFLSYGTHAFITHDEKKVKESAAPSIEELANNNL